MKASAYIRISTQDQVNGHLVDAQERLFWGLFKNRGRELVGVYCEDSNRVHVDPIQEEGRIRIAVRLR